MLTEYLELLDWRRQVAELYAELRHRPPNAATLGWFRARKDALYRAHSQSPLPPAQRVDFSGLSYWPFDARARVTARLVADAERTPLQAESDAFAFARIGHLDFSLGGTPCRLDAYWMQGYAGGLFVPFRDTTSGQESYGGGRYLLDTIKSADLGSDAAAGTLVLDFNYAYHPSCAYDPRWVCPLAPRANWLRLPVRAGERLVGAPAS